MVDGDRAGELADGSGGDPQVHAHLAGVPGAIEVIGEELAERRAVDSATLAKALGGWRGMVDSSLPTLVFVIAFMASGQLLNVAVWAAVGAGALMALWRLVRRQSVQQVLSGFLGVALAAFIASKTGNASDFYLPGLLINAAYAAALVISVLVGWPAIGLGIGAVTGNLKGWRGDRRLKRLYSLVTLLWAGMFLLKLAVQVPLYLMGSVGALGFAKIAMGLPLMVLVAWITYRILRPELARAGASAGRSSTS